MILKGFLLFLFILVSINALPQATKYNKSNTIACHNCYDPQYAANIENVFPYTTTIEIDIWDNEIGSGGIGSILGKKLDQDWYVKHDPLHRGNLNCCGGTFRNCLQRIKDWGDKNPKHNIITVFIDKKENWSDLNEKRKPQDLDQLIQSIFTKESIYSSPNLLGDKGNLKGASATNWASLDALKGKYIFVITDGTEITSRKPLNEYIEALQNNATCFVAPQISNENEIDNPIGFSAVNAKNVVFYNLQYPSGDLSKKIDSINCMSRIFSSPEKVASYQNLVNKKINFIALDNYKLLNNQK